MVFIYVLQLKENKWYIGKTETSKFRIDTHFDSGGSEFTKKYPPQEIYQIIPECDKYNEDRYVKKYMDKYGIDNVRGGTYSRLELTSNEKEVIQKELWGANDLCFLCGGEHFVKNCPNNKLVEELDKELNEESIEDDERLKWIEYYENQLFELIEGCWVLNKTGKSNGLQITSRTDKTILVDKIYSKYNEPPIKFTDIEDIKLKLDGKETNTFEGKLLLNSKTNTPRYYSILIKFKESESNFNSRFYICYDYNFSLLKYPTRGYHGSYFTEHNKKDIEYKLFMLKNEKKEEPQLKLSKTLTKKTKKNKQIFEENFNNILCKIDEIMNNIPEYAISENIEWNYIDSIRTIFSKPDLPQFNLHKSSVGEKYKINNIRAIIFDLANSWSEGIIVIYDNLKGTTHYGVICKTLFNLDIKLKPNDPVLICSKLNELGFLTQFPQLGTSGSSVNSLINTQFAVILE